MTDPRVLLERHRPRLVYDSQEAYFADSAAIWADSPTNVLRRADTTVIARPPKLTLDFLGAHVYGDGTRTLASDAIGDTTRDYQAHATALHRNPEYADRVYGHARRDRQGRLWLQYWLFYYYNDFRLLGLFGAGKHEGDWELVQIRLNANEQPEQAVYSQHKTAETRAWAATPKRGATPLVYIARGSHANYFSAGGHGLDQADGKGPRVTPALEVLGDTEPAWLLWPGAWGDTKAGNSPMDSSSPISPGRRTHWLNPSALAGAAPAPETQPLPPPETTARRAGDKLVIGFDAPPDAETLVVAVRPKGETAPAQTHAFKLDGTRGEVEVPAGDGDYDVWTSVAGSDGPASEGVEPS